MKVLLLFLCCSMNVFGALGQTDSLLTCCSSERGTCYGYSNCTACTSCGYCAHCSKRGGSCGVCSSSSGYTSKSGTYRPSSKTSAKTFQNQPSSAYYYKKLVVSVNSLNVRTGPGTSYSVLKSVKKGSTLIYLAGEGDWIKAKISGTNIVGYVYRKHVLLQL